MAKAETEELHQLALDLEAASWLRRTVTALMFAAVGLSLLWGAHALTQFHHWVPWLFALGLLEPVAVTSLLTAYVILFPKSPVTLWLARSLPRTKLGLVALLVAMLAFVFGTLLWCLIELSLQQFS